ncbi:MAG: hypothetical protein M1832_005457 [Thelocarpon impressellum]|nr:MAG: hypothetical protein M1832_005457 [Thelocarpon impressellum]
MVTAQYNPPAMPPSPPAAPSGQFKILYFASAASYTKKDSDRLDAPLPLSRLFDVLDERYPGMREKVLSSCAVTANLEYVDVHGSGVVIGAGDEVAIIPPVSSG